MMAARVAGCDPAFARTVKSRASAWRPRECAGAMTEMAASRIQWWNIPLPEREKEGGHFGLSAAVFLHSERNFLRSLPFSPLASASFEHSSEAAVRGFSAFFSAGALVSALGASVLAGAVVCADAEPISSSEAMAVAVARAEIFVMGHLGLKTTARPSRCNAEPRMNGSQFQPLPPPQYFERRIALRVVASIGCARIALQMTAPRRIQDDHSSKNTLCNGGVGICGVRGDIPGAGTDRAGVQREIPGGQDRRHARRPEVERFP